MKGAASRGASLPLGQEVKSVVQESSTRGKAFKALEGGKQKDRTLILDETGTELKLGTEGIEVSAIKEIRLGFMTQEFLANEGAGGLAA